LQFDKIIMADYSFDTAVSNIQAFLLLKPVLPDITEYLMEFVVKIPGFEQLPFIAIEPDAAAACAAINIKAYAMTDFSAGQKMSTARAEFAGIRIRGR
jgi:hypothetical protein